MNVIEEVNEPETYNYSKIIRPTSMRSTYWKFFGFPADESGSIITRRSVICSICGFTLSYNKNTSNLKSHLRSKHPDQMNFTYNPPSKKPKFVYSQNNDMNAEMKQVYSVKPPSNDIITNPDDFIEVLAEDADDFPEENENFQIEYITSEDANFDEVLKTVPSNAKSLKRKNSETFNMETSIVSMIVDDLLPTTITEGSGFTAFVTSLCGGRVQVPTSKTIEKHIERLYQNNHGHLSQSIKTEIDEKFFSIGFERWTNKDEVTFITIHINYLTDDDQVNTVVLHVIDSSYPSDTSDWKRHFSMLKMENCAAAIVDFDINEEYSLKAFLDSCSKERNRMVEQR